MRFNLFFVCLFFISIQLFAETENPALATSVSNYQALLKEANQHLVPKTFPCLSENKFEPNKNFCSVKNFCTKSEVRTNEPILYQNAFGEKIINHRYYQIREDLRGCLLEKYDSEIKLKRAELASALRLDHLKKIIAANTELKRLLETFDQNAEVQKIQATILTMSVEGEINGETTDWKNYKPTSSEFSDFLDRAEMRAGVSLNPAIKKSLIELQYLKSDGLYAEQANVIENKIIPEEKLKDPFFDWKLLTDEKAAGGKAELEANRAMFVRKSQDAYDIFKDTQKQMLIYLESKKNEDNLANIERIIERVKVLRFAPPRLTKLVEEKCGDFSNAFYSINDHSLTICPQLLASPKMAIMESIAHEMTHPFDSCNFSGKMYKRKGPMVVLPAPFEVGIKMEPIVGNYRNTFNEDPLDLKLKRIQDKVFYTDHPFSKTISCLEGPNSMKAIPMNLKEIKEKTLAQLAELTHLGQNTPNNIKAKYLNYLNENQKDYFDYFQGCNFNITADMTAKSQKSQTSSDKSDSNISVVDTVARSQMQEAFAMKVASEIVASKLKTLSKSEAEKSILEILLVNENICLGDGEDEAKITERAIKEKCPRYMDNLSQERKILTALSIADPPFNPHPGAGVNIDRTLLAHPEIRKALNCPEDPGVKYCE